MNANARRYRLFFRIAYLTLAAAAFGVLAAQPARPGADAGRTLAEPTEPTPDGGTGTRPALNLTLLPFTPESIRKVMIHHQGKIEACYDEALANREKAIEGRIFVTFVITLEGRVKKAAVRKKGTTLQDPELHDCVISVVTGMSFPKPPDGRDHPVEYPYNLKANR